MNTKGFEAKLGLVFQDRTLLTRALTHRSYLNEHPEFSLEHNERLEFLGDAILDYITGEYLYHHFPEKPEGELTSLRSALVRTETLARFAHDLDLGSHLNMGKGEEDSGGRTRPALLCDAFEALTGAIYLDQGIEATLAFFIPLIEKTIPAIQKTKSYLDAKSQFQELAQGTHKITPHYQTIEERGPDHAKEFMVGAFLEDTCYGQGVGASKQLAAQAAAQAALQALQAELKKKGSATRQ